MTTIATIFIGWGIVALALFWNLQGRMILPSNDHVKIAAVIWPLLIPIGIVYLAFKAMRFSTKTIIIDTAISFNRVVDTYRHGRLLPSKASDGNDLRPKDNFDDEAEKIVETLLRELP